MGLKVKLSTFFFRLISVVIVVVRDFSKLVKKSFHVGLWCVCLSLSIYTQLTGGL